MEKKIIKSYCIDCGIGRQSHKKGRCRSCSNLYRNSIQEDSIKIRRKYWYIKNKYNLSKEEFIRLWDSNNGKCHICNKILEETKQGQQGQNLHAGSIDHDHLTNIVRGILCNACNKGIGLLNDNVKILREAIKYLKGNKFHEEACIGSENN